MRKDTCSLLDGKAKQNKQAKKPGLKQVGIMDKKIFNLINRTHRENIRKHSTTVTANEY